MRIIKGFLKICLWVVISICVLFVAMVILRVASSPSGKVTTAQAPQHSNAPASPATPTALPTQPVAPPIVALKNKPTATPAVTPTVTPTIMPTIAATKVPAVEVALKKSIKAKLAPRNRSDAPDVTLSSMMGVLVVWWPLNNGVNFKENAVKEAAQILAVIHDSKIEYDSILLYGTSRMTDAYGNKGEKNAFWVAILQETMNKINWKDGDFVSYSLYESLPEISDHFGFEKSISDQ